jgi:hypothetical protein
MNVRVFVYTDVLLNVVSAVFENNFWIFVSVVSGTNDKMYYEDHVALNSFIRGLIKARITTGKMSNCLQEVYICSHRLTFSAQRTSFRFPLFSGQICQKLCM